VLLWLSLRLGGGRRPVSHIEFDLARQFHDRFGMLAVLEQRVLDGLRAADEQPAIEAILFLGDPPSSAVPADEDNSREGAARWRFDELQVGIPSDDDLPVGSQLSAFDGILERVARGYAA
jgi:hypothetical protein